MRTVFYLAAPYVGTLLLFYFSSQLLPVRVTYGKMALYLLPTCFSHLAKHFLGSFSIVAQVISIAWMAILCFVYPLAFFEGKKWKRIAFTNFFHVLMMLLDTLCYGMLSPIYGNDTSRYSLMQLITYMVTGWSAYIVVCSLCVVLGRMISARKFQPFHVVFMVFPISQLILVYCGIFNILNIFWVVGVLLGLGAEIALLGYTISQEKKAALEEELSKTRHTMELEHTHYKAVEERQEEMARIRHDFNNQLATIGQLIRQGESGDAQHMISLLADGISKTRENTYCAIPVVNAVLTEKHHTCEDSGIKLDVQLDLPKSLSMEPLHLCSILGNLLDNAIHGAGASGVKEAAIHLSSMVEGDYLFIKVTNPSQEPSNKPAAGHGYGSRILRDLSAHYDGNYWGTFEDGIYTATVSLIWV